MAINFQQAEFIRSATAPKDFPDELPRWLPRRSNVGSPRLLTSCWGLAKTFCPGETAPGRTVHHQLL